MQTKEKCDDNSGLVYSKSERSCFDQRLLANHFVSIFFFSFSHTVLFIICRINKLQPTTPLVRTYFSFHFLTVFVVENKNKKCHRKCSNFPLSRNLISSVKAKNYMKRECVFFVFLNSPKWGSFLQYTHTHTQKINKQLTK